MVSQTSQKRVQKETVNGIFFKTRRVLFFVMYLLKTNTGQSVGRKQEVRGIRNHMVRLTDLGGFCMENM